MNPYKDIDTTTNKTVRIFTQDVDSHELVWHRDREDRIVRVLEGSGWKFQLDNNLPIQLNEGDVIHIPKYEYHRIIKGDTDLKVELYKIVDNLLEESSNRLKLNIPKNVKDMGDWIKNKESELFLSENTLDGISSFKELFERLPKELQTRVYALKNIGQNPQWHPEGNVLKHTIMVVRRALKDNDMDLAIAAMFHDIGKDETAGVHPKTGRITHYGHEDVSAKLAKKYRDWIIKMGGNPANVYYIVKNHMKFKQLSNMRPVKQAKLKSFRAFDKLSKFGKHDRGGLDEAKDIDENILSEGIKVIDGHLTAKDKRVVLQIIKNGPNPAKAGKAVYEIKPDGDFYIVIKKQMDRGLIPVPGSKLRLSTYKSTIQIKESLVKEMAKSDVQKVDQFADKILNPVDVDLTSKHFFDRLNDPRNEKDINQAELIGFFKRLSRNKKKFIEFLDTYKQVVATDDRTNINIPFMKRANRAIAKTIMRKKNFTTPNKRINI